MLAVLLGAFAVLATASIATFHVPLEGEAPWRTANACGPVGAALAYGLVWIFGRAAAFGVPLLALVWSWNRLRNRPAPPLVATSAMGVLLVFEICALFGLAGLDRWTWAGAWGLAGALALQASLGHMGSWITAGALLLLSVLAASEMGFHWIGRLAHGLVLSPARGLAGGIGGAFTRWRDARAESARRAAKSGAREARGRRSKTAGGAEVTASSAPAPKIDTPASAPAVPAAAATQLELPAPPPVIKKAVAPRPRPLEAERPTGPAPTEALPPLSLLELPKQPEDLVTAADLTAQANLLVSKLGDFGIQGRVTEIHPGPVVTMFEFEPAAGVKVNSIVALEDDLALALRASRIRVIAPLPGKGTVGVEIPNPRRRTVYLREVLSSQAYDQSDAALKVPLGVDVNGQPFVADLTRMPHVLVAGSTGAGKSVCLNSVITGLLFQHDPSSLQLVMIDPKMVELSMFNGVPHLVWPVVTDAKVASKTLRKMVGEMETRYKLLAGCGARNIDTYNERVAEESCRRPRTGSARRSGSATWSSSSTSWPT